ncbi:peroxiredoxin family protein [Acaryochloris sp. IP29b_bin.148]|uniref:peroxiredoxin family protein n=1 Tax=Acaryochloris sp. IP29b_bin.148 TaxID=2969218 RepID=UPI00262E1B07|nr:peroxiredoxin family protein [Acaryochloris sp. IP29b_bin.148]
MTQSSGFFNRCYIDNFVPLPGQGEPAVGRPAPDFELPQVGGDLVKLSDYRGQQPVFLAFTRIFTEKLFCPFCYPHIQDLKQRYSEIVDRGAELLMISSTDHVQSEQIVSDLDLPYPFLYDPTCKSFRNYGAGQALAPLPAQYIVALDGKIRFCHMFSFVDHNVGIDEVLTLLGSLH